MSDAPHSDYIVFADESGDHGLVSVDPQFPVFALVFVTMRKDDYLKQVLIPFEELKFQIWGHDQVVFHESDIRKERGDFALLRTDRQLREGFLQRLSEIIAAADFKIVASVIDKQRLKTKYNDPYNPYEIALLFSMERTLKFLDSQQQSSSLCHLLLEARGKTEDNELELELLRILANQSSWGYRSVDFSNSNFRHRFLDKKSNCSGLQLADLVARPIALRTLRPLQPNRAFDILAPKIYERKRFP